MRAGDLHCVDREPRSPSHGIRERVAQSRKIIQVKRDRGAICRPPNHGRSVDDLRPAWPSWVSIGMWECRLMLSSTRAIVASGASS